jgi:hypothetical protein
MGIEGEALAMDGYCEGPGYGQCVPLWNHQRHQRSGQKRP